MASGFGEVAAEGRRSEEDMRAAEASAGALWKTKAAADPARPDGPVLRNPAEQERQDHAASAARGSLADRLLFRNAKLHFDLC